MLIQSRCARCSCMLKHARLGVCWHHPPSRSPLGCLATAKPPQITHPVALSRIPSRVALAIASFFFGLWKVEPLSVSLSATPGQRRARPSLPPARRSGRRTRRTTKTTTTTTTATGEHLARLRGGGSNGDGPGRRSLRRSVRSSGDRAGLATTGGAFQDAALRRAGHRRSTALPTPSTSSPPGGCREAPAGGLSERRVRVHLRRRDRRRKPARTHGGGGAAMRSTRCASECYRAPSDAASRAIRRAAAGDDPTAMGLGNDGADGKCRRCPSQRLWQYKDKSNARRRRCTRTCDGGARECAARRGQSNRTRSADRRGREAGGAIR